MNFPENKYGVAGLEQPTDISDYGNLGQVFDQCDFQNMYVDTGIGSGDDDGRTRPNPVNTALMRLPASAAFVLQQNENCVTALYAALYRQAILRRHGTAYNVVAQNLVRTAARFASVHTWQCSSCFLERKLSSAPQRVVKHSAAYNT